MLSVGTANARARPTETEEKVLGLTVKCSSPNIFFSSFWLSVSVFSYAFSTFLVCEPRVLNKLFIVFNDESHAIVFDAPRTDHLSHHSVK